MLARQGPTLVGIDDVQWLDQPSRSAIAFAARRLTDERLGLLVARRLQEGPGVPLDLDRALPEDRLHRLPIGSLALTELDSLLDARLDVPLSRRTLVRLQRLSGGNPFFALEIGRAILRSGDPLMPSGDLPIPSSLRELVRARLALLAPAALESAQLAAALSRPTVALLDRASGGREGLEAAVAAGVVELDGQRVRFTHPLVASVVSAQLPARQRRELHARLAQILDDPEERGRHLALAAEQPDAAVATALDEAARRARARGAPDAAADLWEQARRLTPADAEGEARRRGVEAAERHFEAGEGERARALLEEIVTAAPGGGDRALALARLGWVVAHLKGFHAAVDVFRAALAEPAEDLALRSEIEEGLAWCLHSTSGVPPAEIHARTALRLAETLGDPALVAGALAHVAFLESLRGRGIAMRTIERAVQLEHSPGWSQILGRPDWTHALLLQWAGLLRRSRDRFQELYQDAIDRGEEHALPFILFQLARVELLTGDWRRARIHARECDESTLHSGQVSRKPYAITMQALVEARRRADRLRRARRHAVIPEGPRGARAGGRPAALGWPDRHGGAHRGADRRGPFLPGSG
jgi:tetratricopeptide (TPR) repeat protein